MQKSKMKNRMKSLITQARHYKIMQNSMRGNVEPISHDLAMIIKQVHSIEKGLAMEQLRLGFGISRIEKMLFYLEHYKNNGGDFNVDECKMACDSLWNYIKLHDDAKWNDKNYLDIKEEIIKIFPVNIGEGYSGTITIYPNTFEPDRIAFEKIVNSRHSIRCFKNEPVNDSNLKKALELAMRAPSACNRQSVRVYILDHKNFDVIQNWTGGVKNFIDQVDKLLIITGQMSAFESEEFYQYTVSAGIFTGYLTLALHTYGIGNCVLQRPLISDDHWKHLSTILHIPDGEQSVCAIAIGVPKDEIKVPRSNRLSFDRVVKNV